MRARYAGGCWLCGSQWAAGAPISRWLGDWVHEDCKAAQAASVAAQGVRTELPDNMDGLKKFTSRKQYQRPGVGHTRGIRKVT